MSELKELKVGDVVSIFDEKYQEWTAERIVKIHEMNEFETTSSYLHLFPAVFMTKWMRGVHPSLIPEGYAIVPIEPTNEMLERVGCMNDYYGDTNQSDQDHIEWYKAMIEAAPK